MIISVKQTKTNFDLVYEFCEGQRLVCSAVAPFEIGRMMLHMKFADGREEQLYFNPYDKSLGGSLKERLSFKVLRNGVKVGTIQGDTEKVGKNRLFGRYIPVFRGEIDGKMYSMYEVGLQGKATFLCGYCGDQQVFAAEKDSVVINYRDTYTLYLDHEKDFSCAVAMMLYYDVTCHGDLGEVSLYNRELQKRYSFQKELLEKYDPQFILRIKKRDLGEE